MSRPWTYVWVNTIRTEWWERQPGPAYAAIIAAVLHDAASSDIRILGEPHVQVTLDPKLPEGLSKAVVSVAAVRLPAVETTHGACHDCGGDAMADGKWCLRCFQTHLTPDRCGTDAGYKAHHRANTDPCQPCKAAHAAANARRRAS